MVGAKIVLFVLPMAIVLTSVLIYYIAEKKK